MEFQEINVIIQPDGQVRLEVHGVKGESCLDLTRDLEAILGGEVLLREMTPEALDKPAGQVELPSNLQTRA